MAKWTKILPFFIVKWLAKKHCERCMIGNEEYVIAYNDTLIKIDESKDNQP